MSTTLSLNRFKSRQKKGHPRRDDLVTCVLSLIQRVFRLFMVGAASARHLTLDYVFLRTSVIGLFASRNTNRLCDTVGPFDHLVLFKVISKTCSIY